MAAATPISKEQASRLYVPYFSVKVEGFAKQLEDVIQVTYRDSVNQFDSCDLVLNNWDPVTRAPKYEPAAGKALEPGAELSLEMGYRDQRRLMLIGEITGVEPTFPASGAPTLSIQAQSLLRSFRKKTHTSSWADKTDSQIAEELGNQQPSDQRPGLGVRVELHPAARNEQPNKFVFMNNQYDVVFLLERARRRGYSFYLDTEQEPRVLRFGPFQEGPDFQQKRYRFVWGKSLVDFRPRLATGNQLEKVTVRGWNRRTREAIVGEAKWGDAGLRMNLDLRSARDAVADCHRVVTNKQVHTRAEADYLAQGILRDQLEQLLTASGTTVGLPDLVAGRKAEIAGLGPRFSGVYFMTSTTHTIGPGGYQTGFTARRETALEGAAT
jgi:phage protein D